MLRTAEAIFNTAPAVRSVTASRRIWLMVSDYITDQKRWKVTGKISKDIERKKYETKIYISTFTQ